MKGVGKEWEMYLETGQGLTEFFFRCERPLDEGILFRLQAMQAALVRELQQGDSEESLLAQTFGTNRKRSDRIDSDRIDSDRIGSESDRLGLNRIGIGSESDRNRIESNRIESESDRNQIESESDRIGSNRIESE